MAVKNHTSNFADSHFGPDYCSSSNAFLNATSIITIIQCIFKIFQIIVDFLKIVFFLFLLFFSNSNSNIKMSLPQCNFALNFTLYNVILKGVIIFYFCSLNIDHTVSLTTVHVLISLIGLSWNLLFLL